MRKLHQRLLHILLSVSLLWRQGTLDSGFLNSTFLAQKIIKLKIYLLESPLTHDWTWYLLCLVNEFFLRPWTFPKSKVLTIMVTAVAFSCVYNVFFPHLPISMHTWSFQHPSIFKILLDLQNFWKGKCLFSLKCSRLDRMIGRKESTGIY